MDWPSSNPQYRVYVGGLLRGNRVRRDPGQKFDYEEHDLGNFFHKRGCMVSNVSLVKDDKTDKSRGYAFVDLEDRASFEQALTLHGTRDTDDVKLLPGVGLQVQAAKQAERAEQQEKQALQKERDATDKLLRDARVHVARINEVMEEIEQQRERREQLDNSENFQESMRREKQRQTQLQNKIKEMRALQASLNQELMAEKAKTRRKIELDRTCKVEEEQDDTPSEKRVEEDTDAATDAPTLQEGSLRVPVIPPAALALHRSISEKSDESPGEAPQPAGALERLPSNSPKWARDSEDKHMKLQRTLSRNSDVGRGIIDQKVEAFEREAHSFSPPQRPEASHATEVSTRIDDKEKPGRWAEMEETDEDDFVSAQLPLSMVNRGRDVLIKGLPPGLSVEQLEAEVRDELARFWTALAQSPLRIESVKVEKRDSCADKVRGTADIVATVTFNDEYDASQLVWNCAQDMVREMTVRSKKVRVEWPAMDSRKMAFRAPTDASSENSYGTVGTRLSKSAMVDQNKTIAEKRRVAHDAPAPAGARTTRGGGPLDAEGKFVSLQNRSVILSNVPTSVKVYDLQTEVLQLLQREWAKARLQFNPERDLHGRGIEQGIEVRPAPAHRKEDENGGTVKIRFRNYADAKWMAEEARNLRIAGCTIYSSWANPKGPKGEAKGGGRA